MTQKKTAAQMRLSGADKKDPKRYAQRVQEERRAALGLAPVAKKSNAPAKTSAKRVSRKPPSDRPKGARKNAAIRNSGPKTSPALAGVGAPPAEFGATQRAAWLEIAAAAPLPLAEAHAPLLGQAACLQAEMMVAGRDFGAIKHSTLTQIVGDLTIRRVGAIPAAPEPAPDAGPKPLIERIGDWVRAIERAERLEVAAVARAGTEPKSLSCEYRRGVTELKKAWAAWCAEQPRKTLHTPTGNVSTVVAPMPMQPLGEPPEEFTDQQRAAWQRIVVASAVELTGAHRPLMRQCSVLSAESLSDGADFAAGKHQCLRRLLRDLTLPHGPEPSGAADGNVSPATLAEVLDAFLSSLNPFALFGDPCFSGRRNSGSNKARPVSFAVLRLHTHWKDAARMQPAHER